jgi:hydroxyacylglutathione hydrolase
LPSHGPPFRLDKPLLQAAIDRLTGYQFMSDFGTCAVGWPLQVEWERDILSGKMPSFE